MRVEFFGQSVKDADSRWSGSGRLVNMYREPTVGPPILKAHMGTEIAGMLSGAVMRAASVIDGVPYAAHGGNLQSIDATAIGTVLDSVPDDENTTITGNNGDIVVTAGDDYFVWDGSTMLTPSVGAFEAAGSATFSGQRTVVTEANGRRLAWSDVADATTFDALNFATAESSDSDIVRAISDKGSLWVFKEDTIEQWGDASDGSGPIFIPGSVMAIGLKGFNLVTKTPLGLFFIGTNNRAQFLGGAPVSTPAVETDFSQSDPQRISYFRDEGRDFCVVHFRNRPAWVYDVALNEWNERASGTGAWIAETTFEAYGAFWTLDNSGNIAKMLRSNQDWDGPLIRIAESNTFKADGELFCVDKFEIEATVGTVGHGQEADIILATSRDYGQQYSGAKIKSLGNPGNYILRPTWRALGQFRQFTAKLTISDPQEITVSSTALIDVS